MLTLRDVHTFYGKSHILHGVSIDVNPGEVVGLLGRNGVGKSTTMRSIMGLTPPASGRLLWKGAPITGWRPDRVARAGIGYVPEDRRIFTDLTVAENLRIAARQLDGGLTERDLLELFPNLADMLQRPASAMSGGEQQMLAVARTLAANPSVVLLDEPSEGIAPLVIGKMREAVLAMKSRGVATLVSEQNVRFAAAIADRAVLIEQGRVVGQATRGELLTPSESVRRVLALGAATDGPRAAAPTI